MRKIIVVLIPPAKRKLPEHPEACALSLTQSSTQEKQVSENQYALLQYEREFFLAAVHPINSFKNGAFNLTELARICDISRTTAYKYIGLLEQ